MSAERVSTGVAGFDRILNGGLIPRRAYLLVGAAGTGKTILSLQWLRDGAHNGETCLYITLAETTEEIERNVAGFGWNLEGIDILDLTPSPVSDDQIGTEYSVFPPSDVEQTDMWSQIQQAVRDVQPERLVVDPITYLYYLATDDYQFRKRILQFAQYLNQAGCTSLLTFEPSELERETSVALAVSGVMYLHMQISPHRMIGLRNIEVQKFRGSDFISGFHPMRITDQGIRVFPHVIETAGDTTSAQEQVSSGIPELDTLLRGGLESGTVTLVTGPAGVGKTTLTTQFLTSAAETGNRTILYTFEESPASILSRSDNLGLRTRSFVDSGALLIRAINPLELYPDEFLHVVREDVEERDCRVVAIDSLRGYQLAMEEYGSLVAHIQNLSAYLHRKQVTGFLVNELQQVTGELVLTNIDISYISDNVLLLRYVEYGGKIIKVVGCLKKRLGDFEPELRQLTITADGVNVSGRLDHLRGVLTGMPDYAEVREGTQQEDE